MKTIGLPQPIRSYVRESLLRMFGYAAEEITQVSQTGSELNLERYQPHLERFDRIRALLDAIGWHEPSPQGDLITLPPHGTLTLVQALHAQREVEREMSKEDMELHGSAQQIESATGRMLDIEIFLAEHSEELRGDK
ncbi:MAG: hypothetical protein ACRDK4_03665 [Solirubrobacteraceae bacterium]